MKLIREYNILFTKMTLNNKIGFIWYLVFPLIAFFVYNYNFFSETPSGNTFYLQTSFFLSYIVFTMSIEVATTLIGMRENGFLKTFTFISGNKYSIILGKVSNQLAFLIVASLIFSFVTSVCILDSLNKIILFILSTLISTFVGAVPLSLFFLIFMLVPIKQEALITILNISLLVLFFVTAKDFSHSFSWGVILLYLNPLDLVRSVTLLITNLINHEIIITNFPTNLILSGIVLYIIVGLVSLKFIKVNSKITRT